MFADNTRYYLGFNLVSGIGPTRLARLIEHCGSVEAAWHAHPNDLAAAGVDAKTSTTFLKIRHQINLETELERVVQAGVRIVTCEDGDYPLLLSQIPAPPPLIYVRGTLSSADSWSIAVVGTRSPTTYGKEATRRIVADLAHNSITIVSGLAMGIDTVAHKMALEAGTRTLGVLACGVDMPYPERNRRLTEQITENGALISEYPLGTRPVASNFPPRNRIISGLSLGTLVVEAGQKSGASITVNFALDQGRDVFAVPGSIFSSKSEGTHRLIRNGAGLATCAQDILEALNLMTVSVQQEIAHIVPDDPTEATLLALLSGEPQHADVLSRTSCLPAAVVASTLALLELKGHVRQVGSMEYVLAREHAALYSARS